MEFLDLSEPIAINHQSADALLDSDSTGRAVYLPELKNLNLKKTKFRKIGKLRSYRKLEKLNLAGNEITDADLAARDTEGGGLEELVQLRLLDISDNPITDVAPIVRLAERKLGFEEGMNPFSTGDRLELPVSDLEGLGGSPNLRLAPANVDPDLVVIASNTQLSPTEQARLTELGVTLIADTSSFNLHLINGLNMISLPLDPGYELNARSFANYLINGENNYQPIDGEPDFNISLIIRHHHRVDAATGEAIGGFETYLPEFDTNEGFPITGGEGYIVNLVSDTPAHTVNVFGTAWQGENQPITGPIGQSPSSFGQAPWAFVVAGQVPAELPRTNFYSVNLKQGDQLIATTRNVSSNFRLALVDMSRQPVVYEGQNLLLEIVDNQKRLVGYSNLNLRAEDLLQAYVKPEIRYNQIPTLTRLLQNYPNPFNPETWIPFELSQQAEVIVSIYNVSGKLVRLLPVGFQPAGVYTSQDRAIYWDGKTEAGEQVASGVYFYNIQIGNYSKTNRMVILK
ncbi:hypothetical protein CMK13_02035 [Candidatus Poribacteria bacterium]|nr:hypothetical protein [Candidatus Poribacteria bacterium]OUT66636.1 MAG: hypothetical protein CBB75_01745 [bacterium TMED15]